MPVHRSYTGIVEARPVHEHFLASLLLLSQHNVERRSPTLVQFAKREYRSSFSVITQNWPTVGTLKGSSANR
jgi:hypothetical protein